MKTSLLKQVGFWVVMFAGAIVAPVEANEPVAAYEKLFALVVTVCVKGECEEYAIDKNFTLADCKIEAKTRHLNDAPFTNWVCIPADVE